MLVSDNARPERREAGAARLGRYAVIDIARGVAVLAMVVYHTAWDLSQLQLIETDIVGSRPWSLFARSVAASFLFLVGIGTVLAHGRGVRWPAFGRRLAVVAAAALAVTVATVFAFPDSYVFFGVLHNIAVSSLLALPFVGAPAAITLAAAAAVLAMPLLVAAPVFDAPLLMFVGLGQRFPNTNDYVPLFPWTGFVLLGVATARLAVAYLPRTGPASTGALGRAVAVIGRHSLAIYLLHQPLIFGALFAVRTVLGPNPAAEMAPFMSNCGSSCRATGQAEELCRASCRCSAEELKRTGLWTPILGGRPSAEELSRATAIARACLDRR